MVIHCKGIGFEALRPLSEQEIASLRQELRDSRRTRVFWTILLAMSPLCLIAGISLAIRFHWQGPDWLWGLPLAIAALLIPMDYVKKRPLWVLPKMALREKAVEVYSGRIDNEDDGPARDTATRAERLPASGLIFSVDGQRTSELKIVPICANVLGSVSKQAKRLGPDRHVKLPGRRLDLRALDGQEMAEMGMLEPRVCPRFDLLLVCWFSLIPLWIMNDILEFTKHDISAILYMKSMIWLGLLGVLIWLISDTRKYLRDLNLGKVELVELANGKRVERLPNSKILWTIDGAPAMWRFNWLPGVNL